MKRTASRNGFTLLELVIVLAILAIVTALATREVAHVQDQQRFEASQRGLETIREAITGSPDDRAPDGSGLRNGFVQDMGRLPDFANHGLSELWTNVTGTAYTVGPSPADPAVTVCGGWRGPYVRLPLGADTLRDGWGNEFDVGETSLGSGIWRVQHWGSDGTPAESDGVYSRNVSIEFDERTDIDAWAWGQVEVNPELLHSGVTYQVRTRLFGVGASPVSPWYGVSTTNPVAQWRIPDPVPIGLRAVRAYRTGGGTTNESPVKYVYLRSGTNGPIRMTIYE